MSFLCFNNLFKNIPTECFIVLESFGRTVLWQAWEVYIWKIAQSLVYEAPWDCQGSQLPCQLRPGGVESSDQVGDGRGEVSYFNLLHWCCGFVYLYLKINPSTDFQIDFWHFYNIQRNKVRLYCLDSSKDYSMKTVISLNFSFSKLFYMFAFLITKIIYVQL